MKYQQVSVDFVNMVYTACTYLMIAGAAWVFLRLLQACFWLPRHLRKQTDIQKMLQDKVESYEKYVSECEEKEKAAAEGRKYENYGEKCDESSEKLGYVPIDEDKWKERRECLEMLKKELKRVRDGGELHDWDYLLEDDEKEVNEAGIVEGMGYDERQNGRCDEEVENMSETINSDTNYSNSNTEKFNLIVAENSEAKKHK